MGPRAVGPGPIRGAWGGMGGSIQHQRSKNIQLQKETDLKQNKTEMRETFTNSDETDSYMLFPFLSQKTKMIQGSMRNFR